MSNKKYSLIIALIFLSLITIVTASTFIDNSQSNFNSGTYNWTFYNSSGFVQLNSSRLNGTFFSQIFNAGGPSQWNNISWVSNAIGELPSNQITETSFGSGNINMTGNVLLLHFNNDSAYGENATRVYDFSGNGNNGTVYSGATWNSSGKINGCYQFNGVNGYINVTPITNLNLSDKNYTISLWIWDDAAYATIGTYHRIISWYDGQKNIQVGLGQNNVAPNRMFYITNGNANADAMTAGDVSAGWHHVVAVKNGTNFSIYLDGLLSVGAAYTRNDIGLETIQNSLFIGQRGNGAGYVNGIIDEVAIWNRSLDAKEILNIYKRGALRLNLSVQSCDDATCSGESWTNLGSNLTSPQNITIANNSYFQYKFDFLTDNVSYTPELYNVSIDYTILNQAPTLKFPVGFKFELSVIVVLSLLPLKPLALPNLPSTIVVPVAVP